MQPKCLLEELAGIDAFRIQLGLLQGEYLADPGEFRKRLTPLLAKCALSTPKVEGRIRWRDFVTHLPDEGVLELLKILERWDENDSGSRPD